MIVFKGCEVYSPDPLGAKEVFLAGSQIVAIEDHIDLPSNLNAEVIHLDSGLLIPGLIDLHVHLTGGGGEGGPTTRTPEMQLSQFIQGGVTTAVGCLGTDGFVRTVEQLLMKAKSLCQEGITCHIYTGAYQVPPPTILGEVAKDLALIEEVIGVGEIALADHRSSFPILPDLIRLAQHTKVGGMLGGKAGITHFHMGDGQKPFDLIYQMLENSEMSWHQLLPTHCNRNAHIFEESKTYGRQGLVDLTASSFPFDPEVEIKPSSCVTELLKSGVPLEHITISSDAGGTLPIFDEQGNLKEMNVGQPVSVFIELIDLVQQEGMPWEKALRPFTSNPADILQLSTKGRIRTGLDADVVVLDKAGQIRYVVAKGEFLMKNGEIVRKGGFEA